MPNADETLTHKDLALALGVSETTIKSYRRKFPRFFPLHSQGKPLRFKPQALEVCRHIRQGFGNDLSVEEIRRSLSNKFQELDQQNVASKPVDIEPSQRTLQQNSSLNSGVEVLSQRFDALLQAQQHANSRLDALQELLADFLSLHLSREDAFSQGLQELKRTWSRHFERFSEMAAARTAEIPVKPSPVQRSNGPKRVLVRNIYGQSNEYLVQARDENASPPEGAATADSFAENLPGAAEKHSPSRQGTLSSPPYKLLEMPLVVRTGGGEYLGVAGKSEGAFSLHDLLALVARAYLPPMHFSHDWRAVSDADGRWRLQLEQEDAIRPRLYALEIEAAKTPRGNDVALLMRFEVQGNEMPPPNIYAFIKQMKQQQAAEGKAGGM